MRVIMLGGAPGVGKSSVARALLNLAATKTRLVQWVDVDALWLHQPWRVSPEMMDMLHSNVHAVLHNAERGGSMMRW